MEIPETGFMRLPQIIGTADKPGPIPVSRSTFYAMIEAGRAPKPIKVGARAVAWRAEDIRALIDRLASEGAAE
jgi:predicted DNA-binding transcriptional regulator AlpA